MRVKRVEMIFGASCGAFAAFKVGPMQKEMEMSYAIFRKTWMKLPVRLAAFAAAYHIGTQLPTRLFRKLSKKDAGIANDTYTGEFDYVSRFRLFENDSQALSDSAESKMLDYLAQYSEDPLSEPELVEHLANHALHKIDVGKLNQVKRLGKDLDDTFYMFGKIHGLENIKYLSDEQLSKITSPVEL